MKTFRVLAFFCGIGGKSLGAKRAVARVGEHEARFETIGGIDSDPLACRDFEMLVGAPTLCVDVHKLEPGELRKFAGDEAPDAIVMSPPCKGFSALLSAKKAAEPQYQEMNRLMLRALFLCCATWDRPPPLIFVENVPLIASRGREIVRQSVAIGEAHGYAITRGTHDCGELGGLAQHRGRWFMVWRHRAQVPGLLYQPPKQRVRACGEVLGPLPIPGNVELGGPMHSVPNLWWSNWLRLAEIPAGGDWRDCQGVLAEGQARREVHRRLPVTEWESPAETVVGPGGSASTSVADPRFGHVERVAPWEEAVGAITSSPAPSSGAAAVADPRVGNLRRDAYGVTDWNAPASIVTASHSIDSGRASVADPRFTNRMPVAGWDEPARAVIGVQQVGSGALSVADPRWGGGRLGVTKWTEAVGTVAGESLPNNGKYSVADPRFSEGKKKNWQRVSGVTPWDQPLQAVTSTAKLHTGPFQVADPRVFVLGDRYRLMTLADARALDLNPKKSPPFIPIIIADDGTWHRPLTTLELGVLQSFPRTLHGTPLVLAGKSHTRWRQAIGNAVPPDAAEAVAEQLLKTLLMSSLGLFALDNNEVWVAPHLGALVA